MPKAMYNVADGVTQSMLAAFTQCRVKSRWQLDGWMSATPTSVYDYGDLMHTLLEGFYKKSSESFDALAKTWTQKLIAAGPYDAEAAEAAITLAAPIFELYKTYWKKSDNKFRWKPEHVEFVFDVRWGGHRLRGKVDAVMGIGRKCWMLETKTKSQISEDSVSDVLSFDFQNLFYITALAECDLDVVGVLYNIIRKPQLKTKSIMTDLAERPDHYFKRFEVIYTPEMIKEFQDQLGNKLADFAAWTQGKLPTYKNESACLGRGTCEFLKACSSRTTVGYLQTRKLFRELVPV